MNALSPFDASKLALIRRTVAKEPNQEEFDLFIELCRARGLNPLLRHAFAQVYNASVPAKRQMVIVVSREGQRSLAERTQNYRPDDQTTKFEYDPALKGPANPLGLVSAETAVYKFSHDSWHRVPEIVFWDEFAPIKEIWRDDKPTGVFHLDPKKDAWKRMPRLMLGKVAEMGALRKAFPDSFGGLYDAAELDRRDSDLTPSELVEAAGVAERQARIGGPDQYIIDWMDGGALNAVPGGQLHDKVMAFLAANAEEPLAVKAFQDRNKHSLTQFWAAHKSDALALKKAIETATKIAPIIETKAEPVTRRK